MWTTSCSRSSTTEISALPASGVVPTMQFKVISGGQTGVDVAALRAAKALGIETGGWMPQGFRTLAGPRFDYMALYGMREHDRAGYASRTEANVRDSHGTLRVALKFASPGEKCTLRWIQTYGRPWQDVRWTETPLSAKTQIVVEFVHGLLMRCATAERVILNVAGNSEATAPGIEHAAEDFLIEVFTKVRAL